MRRFIEEFPLVLATSRKTELSIYMAGLLPLVILLFGIMGVGRIEFPDPYAALAVPIRQGFLSAFGALTAVAFVKLASLASRNYRKARDRLFESGSTSDVTLRTPVVINLHDRSDNRFMRTYPWQSPRSKTA